MAIIIYTLPDCVQCEVTKTYLVKHNLTFETVDLDSQPEEYEHIKNMGHDRVPVVIAGKDHWQGFRPDKLFQLIRK
jgi:glutaredoxin-like protein NrdH